MADDRLEREPEGNISVPHDAAEALQIMKPSSAAARIRIEPIQDIKRIHQVEELQTQVWGFGDRGVLPGHALYTAAVSGGLLLGAFDRDSLVGFLFGLLGWKDGKLCHISHMLGIRPDFQGQGIGECLKQHQRQAALKQGLELMTWTFDPLESRNAYFNLHKLGAYSDTYRENLYDDLGDRLNEGLPTDRLIVYWDLINPGLVSKSGLAPLVPVLENVDGKPVLAAIREREKEILRDRPHLSVVVPRAIQTIKQQEPQGAMAWRLAIRRALAWSFEHGYVARDFRD